MSVPRYKRIYKPKNAEYPLRADGSLLCGPGCFSAWNVLKKRFESAEDARAYVAAHPEWRNPLRSYECEYCKGHHLSGKDAKK